MIGHLLYTVFYLHLKKSSFSLILSTSACADKSSSCSTYKDYCNDPGYKDYLEKGCRATCNFCGKVFTLAVLSYLPCLQ